MCLICDRIITPDVNKASGRDLAFLAYFNIFYFPLWFLVFWIFAMWLLVIFLSKLKWGSAWIPSKQEVIFGIFLQGS